MPGARFRQKLAAVAAPVALAACTSTKDALVAGGADPAYAEGYEHGCSSGSATAGGLFAKTRKDSDRYADDGQYAQGWDAGFAKCQADVAAMVRDARLRNPSKGK